MASYLFILRVWLAALLATILLGPPVLNWAFGEVGRHLLFRALRLVLSDTSSLSIPFTAFVANTAFFLGFLASLGGPLLADRDSSHGRSWNVFPCSLAANFTRSSNSTQSETACVARTIVDMAFDSGRAQRFSWPPGPAALQHAFGLSAIPKAGECLVQRVYPVTVAFVVCPLLGYLLFLTARRPVCRLFSPRVARLAAACVTAGPRRVLFRLAPATATWLTDDFRRASQLTARFLSQASKIATSCVVDVLAPFVFGTLLVVTTATGIVLYGIGHVGVTTLARSGAFGLNKEALGTLLELAKMQCRFLRQLRWSWWLSAAARYEKRYEHHFKGQHEHEHHVCSDAHCPLKNGSVGSEDHRTSSGVLHTEHWHGHGPS